MYKLSVFFVVFLLCQGNIELSAQESINSTGGDTSGAGGLVSYSVGQLVYTIVPGTNGSVAQGIQQPYEISIVTSIEGANEVNVPVSVYPNPATDYLILEVKGPDFPDLLFRMYDVNGKLLQDGEITSNRTSIFMGDFLPSIYFVKVIRNNIEVKIFKIIKIH